MLQIDHLLCLVSEAGPSSAACREAACLAERTGATLHLMPVDDDARSLTEAHLRNAPPWSALDVHVATAPGAPTGLVEGLREYVRATRVDLLVTDTPSDRGAIPPFADPQVQALLRRLPCSVYVVAHQTPLHALRRILVPTDLAASTAPAFECAGALAARYGARIDLLHVVEADPYVALTRIDRLSLSETPFPERRARRQLASFLETRHDLDVAVDAHVAYGDPADQIGHFVNRHEVDLMVLSAAPPRADARASLGPVADRVLRRVACPLLLSRPPLLPDAEAEDPTDDHSSSSV